MSDVATCVVCGEPMPAGETMFKFHGYSGPCPKPPLPRPERLVAGLKIERLRALYEWAQARAINADDLAEAFAATYPEDGDSIRALDNDATAYGDVAKVLRAAIAAFLAQGGGR